MRCVSVVGDVGGGFGGKNPLYPEHVLVLYAARRLGRPVCWIGERGEAFTADYHGRDNLTHARLALDSDGHMLGIAISTRANIGAYTSDRAAIALVNSVTMIPNIYRLPALYAEVRRVYTDTQPTTVYRGASRPEGLYLIERLIDVAAHDLYQRRQLLTCVGPISGSDGHDGFGLIDELVPCLAASLDDGVVVFENAV